MAFRIKRHKRHNNQPGILYEVFPFEDTDNVSVPVFWGGGLASVVLEGALTLSPKMADLFADAVQCAADIARAVESGNPVELDEGE